MVILVQQLKCWTGKASHKYRINKAYAEALTAT